MSVTTFMYPDELRNGGGRKDGGWRIILIALC